MKNGSVAARLTDKDPLTYLRKSDVLCAELQKYLHFRLKLYLNLNAFGEDLFIICF